MSDGFEPRPRVGDEITMERRGKHERWIVLGVKTAKQMVAESKNPENAVANFRAAMGENWLNLYWSALLKSEKGDVTIWMTVMDINRFKGKVESFHKEL